MSVGKRIRNLRKKKGLTQTELADIIGVHYRTLQNWENDMAELKMINVICMADIFGVSVEELLGEETVNDNYIHTAHPKDQFLKVVGKVGEIAVALDNDDRENLIKAIGDTYFTLVALCQKKYISIEECIDVAYDAIKDRTGRLVDGVFIKDE